jgi:hypothetical protein
MNTELQSAEIKDELTAMIDDIIRQFLTDKDYNQKEAQSWCNTISDEIIKAIQNSNDKSFKTSPNTIKFLSRKNSFVNEILNKPYFEKNNEIHYENKTIIPQYQIHRSRIKINIANK